MGERGVFRGHALQAIDGKGRVAIPASLRAVIERNSSERVFVLGRHAEGHCLTGADTNFAQIEKARLARDEERALDAGREVDRDNLARATFGNGDELPFDASGRFILPAYYRARAGLDDLAFFVGLGDWFEIWNPKRLIETPGIPETIRDKAAFELEMRAAA